MEKFGFTCNKCGEQFNVKFEYMIKKDSLICPNCSNTLSDDAIKHLKNIALSIEEYEKIGIEKHTENSNHFDMTIH